MSFLAVAQAAQEGFSAPVLDYHALGPEIVLSIVLAAVLVADLVLDETKKWVIPSIASFGLLATFVPIITLALYGDDVRSMVGGAYVVDNFALVLKGLFVIVGYVVLLMSSTYVEEGDYYEGEYYFLLLAATMGMIVMASSRDLITIFVALETLSIPAYILAGWRKRDLKSNEASLKYYLLGVLASAVMLYGMSLIYGYTGTTLLTEIGDQLAGNAAHNPLVTFAILFVIIGFAFKVSAVPFHSWAPDTYEGAPTPVTAFLSVASKTGGFVALFQLIFIGFFGRDDIWGPLFGVLAVLTMTVGNLVALRQTNIVRMLAYSSIAQAGYILVPLAIAGTSADAAHSALDGVDRLPAHLRGDEPGCVLDRVGGGPQDPLGRDLVVRRALRVRPRPGHPDVDLRLLAGRHPAAGRVLGQDLHVPGGDRRRHRLGRRPRRGGRRQLGDRPLLLRQRRPPDVDESGPRRRSHPHQGAHHAGDGAGDLRGGRRGGGGLPAAVRALRRSGIAGEVARLVADRAAASGPVRFDEVVELALYHPTGGFYEGGGGAGRGGADFITSPEVGGLFGAVVARALQSWWTEHGRPDPFVVVEVGAGTGTLARAILAAGVPAAVRYVAVERSAVLRAMATDRLAGRAEVVADLPRGSFDGVILANELLDNLPFRLLQRTGDAGGRQDAPDRHQFEWAEVFVDGNLGEVLIPAESSAEADRLAPDASVGTRIPLQHTARDWVDEAIGRLRRGRLLIIDYADTTPSLASRPWTEWVRTYRGHGRAGHPLEDLGSADITCEVAADQLTKPTLNRSQADFLRAHGIDDLVDTARMEWTQRAHIGDLRALKARSRITEAAALTDPSGLGAFRVLEWEVAG